MDLLEPLSEIARFTTQYHNQLSSREDNDRTAIQNIKRQSVSQTDTDECTNPLSATTEIFLRRRRSNTLN